MKKMSMLYLKSQVNPHFLYNTLDTIRIQAQLDGDKKVADLLMKLADFFRLSVKVDRQMVTLDDELQLLEAYMDLMCYRYPKLNCRYDIDPDLGDAEVPNFILQPMVENALLHGLKNKGYIGEITIHISRISGWNRQRNCLLRQLPPWRKFRSSPGMVIIAFLQKLLRKKKA